MLIQTVPVPKGTDSFERTRQQLVKELHDSIPEQYRLPEYIADDPPADVTGIPKTCGILTEDEIHITEDYDATSLAEAIASKHLTAVAVATAFCKRAAIAHQLTCCLTQYFPDEALERAKYLDDYLAEHGRPIGPLHGVPVSVKEHMMLAGHYSSYGYLSSRAYNDQDALLIKNLRDAGAVFYVKTNQPQGIMHLESDGFMGRVNNPHNIHLSAGGSTGGESALIAMKGSVLGIGTDIGGSIRGPSAFCGIFGFKPTCYTLSMKDFLPGGFPAELNVLCSTGPMGRSLRDMDLFMKVLVGSKQYMHDPRIVPIPWTGLDTKLSVQKPIKIGVMMNDGVITPQPPVIAAMQWVQKKLEGDSNFILKPFTPYKAAEAMKMIGEMYWPDNGLGTKKALAATGEPVHELTKAVLSPVTTDFSNLASEEKTATEITSMRVARDTFRCSFISHWNSQDIDFVLAPCFVGPACKHDTALYWNYTALWNFVDYPAIVLPTPIKSESTMTYAEGYKPLSEKCEHVKKMWESDPKGFEGAPICVQVIARKHFDNELFGVVGEMDRVCGWKVK